MLLGVGLAENGYGVIYTLALHFACFVPSCAKLAWLLRLLLRSIYHVFVMILLI